MFLLFSRFYAKAKDYIGFSNGGIINNNHQQTHIIPCFLKQK